MSGIGRADVVMYLRRMADKCAPGDRPWLHHAAHLLNRDEDTVITCRVPGCLTCKPTTEERHGDQAI